MNDNLEKLLSRLQKVEQLPAGSHIARYRACCPAHDDSKPSLSVTLAQSGAILLKCWTGCSAEEVITAAGMEMTELFPPVDRHHSPKVRRPFSADQAASVVSSDASILALAAAKLRNKEPLSDKDISDIIDIQTRSNVIKRGL